MDSNDNSSKENCIPPNVENQETGNAPVSKGSPGGTKRPAAGSRPRPPIPQKPPVAKKPNLTTGSHCVSKSASTCTVPNSTSSPPTETLHTHSSSSVPPVKTSADKKANKQSVNNNRAECNNTSDVVSVKDRTKTLGLYAAGKSLFYIDQKFVHAPAPQTNPPSASAHSTGKDNACTHTPVSEPPARTRSAKLRLPLIGFKRNSKPSSSVKAKRSEWYTEFEPDFGDVSVVKEDVHPATASRVDKSRVDESGKTRVQGSATADVEAKPNASLLSNTFTESANKTGPPKSPKPATRKSVQPKSTTSSPSPQKVRPQPVPRKRRNVMSTISTDGLNSSVPESVMESKNSPANSMSAKDSVNAGKDNDSKIQPNEYVPQIIENDLKPDHCSALSKVDDSDAAVTNGTAEKTDHLEDSECGEVVCCETTADVSPNNGNTFQTPSGASTDVQHVDSEIVEMLPQSNRPPPVPQKTKRRVSSQIKSSSVQQTDSQNELKPSSMESKHVSSSLVPNETTDQPADNESNFTDDVHVCGSQSDVVEIKTEYVDSRPLHQDDSVTLRNKTEAAESYSPQHHSDALESQTELLDNDTYPEPDSLAQLPDTCDMLKEIEDLLSKTLGDVGLTSFSDDFLNDSVEINSEEPDEVKDKPKPVHDGRPKSESFSGEMPSRPPRPKRDATKKLKQWVSLDQHSDSSSCDSASESFKKACPPKPKRTLPPRVNRSQSDVSGMKSLIEQLENRFEESKPAIPPRNESFGSADRPPPLPPRNNSRCNSLDLSSISQNSSTEDGNTEVGKAPPFPKPPRRVIKRPSRKAPPPPPHPPTQKPDLSTAPCTLSASVCVVNKGLDSEKRISYRTSASDESLSTGGPTSVDHDYHEIPDSECIAVPVKEITPPPELPPRILKGSRPSSQMSATNDSDTGSVKSDAVSLSKPDSDDSSSICSSQSSASPSKPLDMCRPCSMPISESPLLSTREHRLSSVSSNSGSFENVNRMNDLSSGSDSEEDEEEKQLNKKAKKARYIAKEIMESEAVFVDVLKLLNIDFRVAVSQEIENVDRPVIPSETLNRILDYLPQLQSINEDLLKDIRDRFENWDKCQKLADVFVKKGPFLKLYSSYIRNFENATTLLDESCKKYASFASCVKEFEKSPRCANLALKHYMLKPIQRIPQYKLLLQDYLKNLSPDSPDYNNTITALSIVSEVADHANESMRHGDEMHQMMEIQHLLIGQFEVIQPGRSLLKKGELMKMSRKEQQPRMFFLFTDVLLYTTPTATGYRLNNILPLIGMKVGASDKPTPDEYGNEFSILSVQRSFTVSARTPKERTEWMTALSDAIKELTQKRDTFHSKEKGTRTFSLDKDFVLGHKAPLWIPDRRVTMCMLCLGEFTITWRRHHCRACGRIVCGYCSENKAPLRYLKYRSDRVCDECFDKLQQEIEEKELSGETVEDVTFPCPDEGTASKLSLSTIKERFQKIRWSGRARKKYAPPRSSVLKEVKANDVGSSMSGYLRMYHNKKWKRFWFVAKNNVLYTYKASEDMAAIKSTPVLGFEASVITEWFEGVEPDLAFQLVHPNTTPLIFRTDSAAATTKWVNIMRESVCKMA